MLKEFRSIDVYWDKATRRIYEEIRSSSSDEKGRKLTVQIVNDGQIQDLTNVALNLYWETQDGENRGLRSIRSHLMLRMGYMNCILELECCST